MLEQISAILIATQLLNPQLTIQFEARRSSRDVCQEFEISMIDLPKVGLAYNTDNTLCDGLHRLSPSLSTTRLCWSITSPQAL